FGPGGGGPPGAPTDDADQTTPTVFDPERMAFQRQLYAKMSEDDLSREETRVLMAALDQGRPIYAVLSASTAADFRSRLSSEGFVCSKLASWQEPADTMASADDVASRNGARI